MKFYKKREYIFPIINGVLLIILAIFAILPLIHFLALSLSSGVMTSQNLVGLMPKEFTLASYKEAISDKSMILALGVSIKRVILGTVITMSLTIMASYSLSISKKNFYGREIYVTIYVISMLFTGGLIPTYTLIAQMKLMNRIWALVIPGAVPVFNVIVLLNFNRSIPLEINEAAMIDGADDFKCLFWITLPLSIPALITLTIFCIIGHWNAWFDALIYMRNTALYPLQTFLQVKIASISVIKSLQDVELALKSSERGLIAAYVLLSTIPILIVFPFLQRYIKSGLILGSVKG